MDIAITLLNKDHYKSNINMKKKRVVFRPEELSHGNSDIITIADLMTSRPRYTDSNGEFLVELSLSRVRTVVEKDFLIGNRLFGSIGQKNLAHKHMISSEFSFGSFVWTVRVSPEPVELSDKISVHIAR